MTVIPSAIGRLAAGAGALHAVGVALKLDIFEVLGGRSRTVRDVASRVKAEERSVGILLEALKGFGYVTKEKNRYSNSAETLKWILRGSETSLADAIELFEDHIFEFWRMNMEDSIRRGKPQLTMYEWFNDRPSSWRTAQATSASLARLVVDDIVARVKLHPKARRLLDVGGAHGLLAIKFCLKYPHLRATVFDLPEVLAATHDLTQKFVANNGVGDRISFQKGDYWKDDLGTGYDVVLLTNIIHGYVAKTNAELIGRLANTLNPGGQIIIFDRLGGGRSEKSKAGNAFLGLNYLVTLGGQTYTVNEVSRWLKRSVFGNIRGIGIHGEPSLVIGSKRQIGN